MKTTIEIPDPLLRRAKSKAAEGGRSLKDFITESLQEKLASSATHSATGEPAWMSGFGKLGRLRRETALVQRRIDREFGAIEAEDRA